MPGMPGAAGSLHGQSSGVPLAALKNNPILNMEKMKVQKDPNALLGLLIAISMMAPQVMEEIKEHQAEFVDWLQEPVAGAPKPPGSTGGQSQYAPASGGDAMAQMFQQFQAMQGGSGASQSAGSASQASPPIDQQAMMQLIQALGGGGGAPPGGPQVPQPAPLQLSAADNAAIDNLVEMGFSRQEAMQAYETAEKDVDTAAAILFSQRD